jgi:hypothetical protein
MKSLGVSERVAMYEESLAPASAPVTIVFGHPVEHVVLAVTGGDVHAEWNADAISGTASHYLAGEAWAMDIFAAKVTLAPDPGNSGTATVRVQVLEDGD